MSRSCHARPSIVSHASRDAEVVNSARPAVVLIVDDEPLIRSALRTTLETAGYAVIEAEDGAEALGLLATAIDRVSVVLSDVTMPGLDGIELVTRLERWQPGLPVVLASGLHSHSTIPPQVASRVSGFLEKPYSPTMVLDVVAAAIARKDGQM